MIVFSRKIFANDKKILKSNESAPIFIGSAADRTRGGRGSITMTSGTDKTIGAAVRELRKHFGWSQRELADRVGLGHAQTVSEIENGGRGLKASEVVRLAELFQVSANDLLAGRVPSQNPAVLWRDADSSPARREVEARFLERCRRYAFLEEIAGSAGGPSLPSYPIDFEREGYEDSEQLAEGVRKTLELGDVASKSLRENLESRWGVKILEELMDNGSGATAKGEFGPAILENAAEPPKRRAFSLAHELFHLLTWGKDAEPCGGSSQELRERREKKANAFAAALLMPREVVSRKLSGLRITQLSDLLPAAAAIGVSTPALAWRSVNLGLLARHLVERVLSTPDSDSAVDRGWVPPAELDRPLPERYVSLAYAAYMRGDISIGKLSELVETNVGMVEHRLDKYGLDLNADEYQAEVLPA
jgi:Zn-dependent peptidase ImmA (M78 family)/transcriptional regulator with XRE-family HTH domain/predicted HTH domain antitoxin